MEIFRFKKGYFFVLLTLWFDEQIYVNVNFKFCTSSLNIFREIYVYRDPNSRGIGGAVRFEKGGEKKKEKRRRKCMEAIFMYWFVTIDCCTLKIWKKRHDVTQSHNVVFHNQTSAKILRKIPLFSLSNVENGSLKMEAEIIFSGGGKGVTRLLSHLVF